MPRRNAVNEVVANRFRSPYTGRGYGDLTARHINDVLGINRNTGSGRASARIANGRIATAMRRASHGGAGG